ncbi:hypothetical protein LWI28_022627 [Acer negundo]|uniref:Uncharacterized protein n=1 Tax=Acer negundo TaxID=4023 RepID=A0AAD5J0R5_ACENE|nr:hypothetical protein LWI28_022627 [Acer negundo]
MSEEDKLFNFMLGLQKWAQAELRRQGVKDIPTAMAAIEGLVDFHLGGSTSNSVDKGKSIENKFGKNKEKDWKKKADGKKEKEKEVETTKGKDHIYSKFQGCFICSGPHRARDCLMKEKVSALVCQEAESSDSDDDVVLANPIQLLNTMRMERLELNLSNSRSLVKAVNSKVVEVLGVAETNLKVGTWHGTCMVNVVRLDDFELILGNEFFMKAKVSLMSYLRGILIRDCENPCFIQVDESLNKQEKEAYSAKGKGNMALDRGKLLVTLETKPSVVVELKREVDDLQASKVSCSGPVQFQRKQAGNCSKLRRGPKQLVEHEGRVTVSHNDYVVGSGSLGEELAHQRLGVSVSRDPSLVKGEKSEKVSLEGLYRNRLGVKAKGCLKNLPTRTLDVSSGGGLSHSQKRA